MASVALKDLFFTVSVHNSHEKYFTLELFQTFYNILGMPNGYSDAMESFTKILKPVLDIYGIKVISLLYLLTNPICRKTLNKSV